MLAQDAFLGPLVLLAYGFYFLPSIMGGLGLLLLLVLRTCFSGYFDPELLRNTKWIVVAILGLTLIGQFVWWQVILAFATGN